MIHKSRRNHRLFSPKAKNKCFVFFSILVVSVVISMFFYQLERKKLAESIKQEAQSSTKNSLVEKIDGLQIWLESSSPENFDSQQSKDGVPIDKGWKGINKIDVKKNNSESGNINQAVAVVEGKAPIYANSINGIPAIKFQGESALVINSTAINDSDYTIVIVEQRESAKSDNYILGDPANTKTNQTLLIGYKTDGSIIHSHGDNAYYTSSVSGYSSYNGPRVLIFTHSAIDGNKTYINGALAGQSNVANVKGHISNLKNLAIGKNYIGQIGELIAYNKSLSLAEIQSVYDYTINKWRIKVGATKDDCSNGIVASYSCDLSSCAINIAGISRTQVRGTISTSYLKCDKTGYTGLIQYSCNSRGLITYPYNASCSCATGYSLVNNVCTPITCPVSITGVSSPSSVSYTTSPTSITCNATGYTGTVNYTCTTGTLSVTGSCTIGCTPGSQTFNYTGGSQTFTVPNGCSSLNISAYGAEGGKGYDGDTDGNVNRNGGLGAYVTGTVAVTSGQNIIIYVGGAGTNGNPTSIMTTSGNYSIGGGFNGGGNGIHAYTTPNYHNSGGGGGGASDVRIGGSSLSNRVIIAAGGGGAGSWYDSIGGNGGCSVGTDGSKGRWNAASGYGTAGSQSAGGSVGGSLGVGGFAGGAYCGAGGGGGYYGGGGSSGCNSPGAGGGSSLYNGTCSPGVRSGNGQVVIGWQ